MKKQALIAIAILTGVSLAAAAPTVRPVTIQQSAKMGATHVVEIDYADFTETSTNTAESFGSSFPVVAKMGVECVGAQLITAFTTGNTNFTTSVAVTVGDGTDADLYLTSTELASDGTEVWWKYGRSVWNSGSATNVTLSYGQKVYTGTDNIDFTFTPNAEEALSACTAGKILLYFKIQDARTER